MHAKSLEMYVISMNLHFWKNYLTADNTHRIYVTPHTPDNLFVLLNINVYFISSTKLNSKTILSDFHIPNSTQNNTLYIVGSQKLYRWEVYWFLPWLLRNNFVQNLYLIIFQFRLLHNLEQIIPWDWDWHIYMPYACGHAK